MLWYSWSGQRWSNLLQCSAPCYSLLTFTDNTALPVFLYFDTCLVDVSLHRIIIYIHFPLIYVICLALTHITRSYLCMNGWQRRAFSFSTHTHTHTRTHTHTHTHTHTEARVRSQWGHKHMNCSESHFMTVSQFHLSKTIIISYTHRNVKVFTATRQNKSPGFCRNICSAESTATTTKIMKTYFLRNSDHTTFATCFNFNSKFPLYAKKV